MGGAVLTKRAILLIAFSLSVIIILTTLPSKRLSKPVLSHYYDWKDSKTVEKPQPVPEISWNSDAPERVSDIDTLSYREKLESHSDRFKHSPTLTFSKIFVLSLRKRQDRRERMRKLADALGLEFIFVDATDKDENVIAWIGERVAEVRKSKAALIAHATGLKLKKIGGGGVTSPWLLGVDVKELALPSLQKDIYGGQDWVSHLASANPADLLPTPGYNVTQQLYDPLEKNARRQVVPAVISTFYSHTKLMRVIAEENLDSALILEDDVDLEWDLERAWANVERRLPTDWDISFLGSCWGSETQQPAYLHPGLHRSTAPRCLHGYAVSRSGALKILTALSDPWVAFQAAIDTVIPFFIQKKVFNSFSLVPPLIIQLKDGPSDIQEGNGTAWRGVLADSTMERIWEDEGEDFDESLFDEDEKIIDPALLYRGGAIDPPSTHTLTFLANLKSTPTSATSRKTTVAPIRNVKTVDSTSAAITETEASKRKKPAVAPKQYIGNGGKFIVKEVNIKTSSSEIVPVPTVVKDGPKRIGTGARPGSGMLK